MCILLSVFTSGNWGGICSKQTALRYGRDSTLNTGVVTIQNYGQFLPPRHVQLTLAHELGHSLGSILWVYIYIYSLTKCFHPSVSLSSPNHGLFVLFVCSTRASLNGQFNSLRVSPPPIFISIVNLPLRSANASSNQPNSSRRYSVWGWGSRGERRWKLQMRAVGEGDETRWGRGRWLQVTLWEWFCKGSSADYEASSTAGSRQTTFPANFFSAPTHTSRGATRLPISNVNTWIALKPPA